jgi:hypothetical protein
MLRAVGCRAHHNLERQERSRQVWIVGPWQKNLINRAGPNDPPSMARINIFRRAPSTSKFLRGTTNHDSKHECADRPATSFRKEEIHWLSVKKEWNNLADLDLPSFDSVFVTVIIG